MLIDTNVLISIILRQNDYKSSVKFFDLLSSHKKKVVILDFAIYSTCLILKRRNELAALKRFPNYLESRPNFSIYRLSLSELSELNQLKINLDFDDSIHYFLAKKNKLQLVSYDRDFDKTDLKRLTPAEALEQLI
jgi:uncharacterized protein